MPTIDPFISYFMEPTARVSQDYHHRHPSHFSSNMTINYPTYSLEESSIIMNQILDQQFKLLWKQAPSFTPSISVACQSSLSPSPIDLLDNILSQFDTFFDDDIFNNDAHLPDTKATEYNDNTLPATSYNSPLISNDIFEIGTSNTVGILLITIRVSHSIRITILVHIT